MSELDRTTSSAIKSSRAATAGTLQTPLTIRVSPHGYLTALLIGTFFSALFFYIEIDAIGFALFGVSWILLPFFALNDRISFDGRSLTRTGYIPRAWAWFNGSRKRLKITDIEQVETQAIRALKRGGNIYYRYRTTIHGKGLHVTIASGGDEFRRMIKSILEPLAENSLDVRSIELREHLADPKETLMKAEFSRIPSADVLKTSLRSHGNKRRPSDIVLISEEKAEELQELANELRLGGYLVQALEAFRRALRLRPTDASLLFEFARCLHSIAGVERDKKLERKAFAAMRLTEKRAGEDADLLSRVAEFYFQLGEWRRAGIVFQRVIDRADENFRAARGMAEMALREGKIAHVIHHFSTANRLAETPALRRWAQGEADYFTHLNSDDEYMEMEIGRVNLLETLERSKKTALRIASLAFPAVMVGLLFEDDLIANIGWAVSTVSILVWSGLILSAKMFTRRIPYDLMPGDE